MSIAEEVASSERIGLPEYHWSHFLVDMTGMFPGGEVSYSGANYWADGDLLQQGMDTLLQNLGIPMTMMQCGVVPAGEGKLWPTNPTTPESPQQK